MTHTWSAPSGWYNAAVDLVDRHVPAGLGEKVAFVDPSRELTYGALEDRTNRFANLLAHLGIAPEQRLVLILRDTTDFPVAFWGAIKAGVVAVPVSTMLAPDQWHHLIEDSRAAGVVVSAELLDQVAPVLRQVQKNRSLAVMVTGPDLEGRLADAEPRCHPARTHADEVAFWLYTSGSTGRPKGARHLHASLATTAECYGHHILGITSDDVVYSVAKLFFAYGLGNGMSFPLSVGATAVLLPDRPTPTAVFQLMRTWQPTIFCGVPTLLAAMLANPDLTTGAGSPRLRTTISAGEALPQEIGQRWRARVGTDVLDGIGSTEMLHIFISNRPNDVRYGSTGKPVPGYQARVVDEAGHHVATGEIGELLVAGPTAADGYWNQRDRSRKTFAGEWTHTGDKYRVDRDGYFYYCGRTDDMFKVSGIWVAPFEVESALVTHPSVLEAAVVGQEDVDGLIKPKTFVVLAPTHPFSPQLFDQLKEHVKAAIGPWKYPRWIEVVAELPKTATGKIQRYRLRGGANPVGGDSAPA